MASAFQVSAFQLGAFQMEGRIVTDTGTIQLPIDCVLAGHQPYEQSGREYEIRPRNLRSSGNTMRSGVRALRGGRPWFTTTTNNRGYD